MKILVTGACGRIGRVLTEQLIQQGHSVVGLDLSIPKQAVPNTASDNAPVRYIQGSASDAALLQQALRNVDAVAHLAAQMSWRDDQSAAMMQSNVQGTFALLKAAQEQGVQRFVLASTGEVYPETSPQYQPIGEAHPLLPTSVYGQTKKLCEDCVQFFGRNYALAYVILRFPHTQEARELLDPASFFSGPRFFLQAKIEQMKQFGKSELAEQLRRYDKGRLQHLLQCNERGESYAMHISDVRDTAAAVVLALSRDEALGQVFNVTTDAPWRFADILPRMAAITGCEVVPVNFPGPGVIYHTDNSKIKASLGYQAHYGFDAMLAEAQQAWEKRKSCAK